MDATGVNDKSKKDLFITLRTVLGVSENYLEPQNLARK